MRQSSRFIAVALVASLASSTSVTTVSAAQTFKPSIPISLPVTQDKAIIFDNAVELYDQIPAVAWQNVQDVLAANPAVTIPTTLVIGPRTDTSKALIEERLLKSYSLWKGFQQPPSMTGLVFNATDVAWAQQQWPKLATRLHLTSTPKVWYPDVLRNGCYFEKKKATACYGGNALIFPTTTKGFVFYGVQSPFWSEGSLNEGTISQVAHEYTHLVQFAQWIGKKLSRDEHDRAAAAHKVMPCWFQEGQANAIGLPISASTVESYVESRDYSVRRPIMNKGSIPPSLSSSNLTADALSEFLYSQKAPGCYNGKKNGDYQLGYNVGFAAVEVLVAVGGPQSTMALVTKAASGMTWSKAFQAVYGLSWKRGSAIIGQVLAAEYVAKPMM